MPGCKVLIKSNPQDNVLNSVSKINTFSHVFIIKISPLMTASTLSFAELYLQRLQFCETQSSNSHKISEHI